MNEPLYQLERNVINLYKDHRLVELLWLQGSRVYANDIQSGRRLSIHALTGQWRWETSQVEISEAQYVYGVRVPDYDASKAISSSTDSRFKGEFDATINERRKQLVPAEVKRAPMLSVGTQLILEKMISQQVSADQLTKGLNQLKKLDGMKLIINYVQGWMEKDGKPLNFQVFIQRLEEEAGN